MPARKQLSAQEKETLRQILESAEGEAAGFSPGMRAYSLWQVSLLWPALDAGKGREALRSAFEAAMAIEDDEQMQQQLMQPLGESLASADPAYAEQQLGRVEGRARQVLLSILVAGLTRGGEVEQALALLEGSTSTKFPYDAAMQLMQVLPEEQNADLRGLFSRALGAYRSQENDAEAQLASRWLARMVLQFWQRVPPDLAVDTMEELLEQAKTDQDMQVTLGSEKGSASFATAYDYRLFQFLPILRELDHRRYERLLEENHQMRALLEKYPQGTASVESDGQADVTTTYRISENPASVAEDQFQAEMRRRTAEIVRQAEEDPRQATAAAQSLPARAFHEGERTPRVEALLGIARVSLKARPSAAHDALAQAVKVIEEENAKQRFLDLAEAARLYLKLGETDGARELIKKGAKAAEELHKEDSDSDDPNRALKAYWPSTVAWRQNVVLATRFAPDLALEIADQIPDPEIRASERIAMAAALLGMDLSGGNIQVRRKSESWFSFVKTDGGEPN